MTEVFIIFCMTVKLVYLWVILDLELPESLYLTLSWVLCMDTIMDTITDTWEMFCFLVP